MKIIDDGLLAEFRTPGRCERCGVWCRKREPHHVFTRGAGRLDIRINLVALGSTRQRQCHCHSRAEEIGRDVFLEIVAGREKLTVEAIVAEVYRLRRLPQPFAVPCQPKKKRVRSAWQIRAGELRRARWRADYKRAKEWKKGRMHREGQERDP